MSSVAITMTSPLPKNKRAKLTAQLKKPFKVIRNIASKAKQTIVNKLTTYEPGHYDDASNVAEWAAGHRRTEQFAHRDPLGLGIAGLFDPPMEIILEEDEIFNAAARDLSDPFIETKHTQTAANASPPRRFSWEGFQREEDVFPLWHPPVAKRMEEEGEEDLGNADEDDDDDASSADAETLAKSETADVLVSLVGRFHRIVRKEQEASADGSITLDAKETKQLVKLLLATRRIAQAESLTWTQGYKRYFNNQATKLAKLDKELDRIAKLRDIAVADSEQIRSAHTQSELIAAVLSAAGPTQPSQQSGSSSLVTVQAVSKLPSTMEQLNAVTADMLDDLPSGLPGDSPGNDFDSSLISDTSTRNHVGTAPQTPPSSPPSISAGHSPDSGTMKRKPLSDVFSFGMRPEGNFSTHTARQQAGHVMTPNTMTTQASSTGLSISPSPSVVTVIPPKPAASGFLGSLIQQSQTSAQKENIHAAAKVKPPSGLFNSCVPLSESKSQSPKKTMASPKKAVAVPPPSFTFTADSTAVKELPEAHGKDVSDVTVADEPKKKRGKRRVVMIKTKQVVVVYRVAVVNSSK